MSLYKTFAAIQNFFWNDYGTLQCQILIQLILAVFQTLVMTLKLNKQNTVRLPQMYQFLLLKHKMNC